MNTTDTDHIRAVLADLPVDNTITVRRELGMGDGPVGVFMGGIYPPKRTVYLLDAARKIRQLIPDFELLVIGGGSESSLVEAADDENCWVHYVGPEYGDERLRLASVGSIQLMPGMVGLNIVDAFALGLPTITTDITYHSPEIDYLLDGLNGSILHGDPSPADFGHYVAALLDDEARLAALQHAAEESGRELTIENMAINFADGIVAALEADKR